MIWMMLGTVLVGFGAGFFVATKSQQKKAQAFFDETVGVIQKENEELVKTAKKIEQKLADTEYKLSETEKDYRYVKDQLDRKSEDKKTH